MIERMKVKILVEFEVVRDEGEDYEDQLTEEWAKGAASMAAWHHVCLTANGLAVTDRVEVHVDGFGKCEVKMGSEHE